MKVPLLRLGSVPRSTAAALFLFCPNALQKWRTLEFDFPELGPKDANNLMAVVMALARKKLLVECPNAFEEGRGRLAMFRYISKVNDVVLSKGRAFRV